MVSGRNALEKSSDQPATYQAFLTYSMPPLPHPLGAFRHSVGKRGMIVNSDHRRESFEMARFEVALAEEER
jgi:hypothetical protein